MEGGIGILLLLIIAVVVAVIGVALYVSGGAIWAGKKTKPGDDETAGRPAHKSPQDTTQEKVEFVGTGRDDDR
jgi:hypothetical protein